MQDFWLVVLIFSDWPTVANYVATEWSGVAPAAGESQLHA